MAVYNGNSSRISSRSTGVAGLAGAADITGIGAEGGVAGKKEIGKAIEVVGTSASSRHKR